MKVREKGCKERSRRNHEEEDSSRRMKITKKSIRGEKAPLYSFLYYLSHMQLTHVMRHLIFKGIINTLHLKQ